jgi:hypothetical protein
MPIDITVLLPEEFPSHVIVCPAAVKVVFQLPAPDLVKICIAETRRAHAATSCFPVLSALQQNLREYVTKECGAVLLVAS